MSSEFPLLLLLIIGLQECPIPRFSVKIIATSSNQPFFDPRTSRFIPRKLKFQLEKEYRMGFFNVFKVDENGQKLNECWRIATLPGDEPQLTMEQVIATQKKYYPFSQWMMSKSPAYQIFEIVASLAEIQLKRSVESIYTVTSKIFRLVLMTYQANDGWMVPPPPGRDP